MHLGPHHFQAQSRYFENSIHACMAMLWPAGFGLVTYALDFEALKNGTVNLLHASGIMPDGLPFSMPGGDGLPEPRNFAKLFPPDSYSLTVSLAIPPRLPNGINCALNNSDDRGAVRFLAVSSTVADETTGADEKAVRFGRKNLRLVLDSELTGNDVSLPVARIMRSGSGEFIVDPEFVPPCLQIGASQRLMEALGRLIEIMEEKSSSLTLSSSASDVLAFSSREIAAFWFLHTVNAGLAPLRHHYLSRRTHPEEVFIEMLRLSGGLCTFALNEHPRTLPAYDHWRPDVCFGVLERHIREQLELIIPTNCIKLPIAKTMDYFYAGAITDERCVGRVTWLLGVRSKIAQLDLMTKAPQLVKICSEKFVGELVRRQMRGLNISHLSVPPPAVSPRPEMQYFLIDRTGPFWENIVQTRRVGIYIPGDIPDPEVEVLVILE